MTTATQLSAEQRKKFLILQGQVFRLGILDAQHSLAANLRRDVLFKSAVAHLVNSGADVARNAFSLDGLSRGIFNGRLALALPVLAKTIGFLSRRHLLMPAGIALAVGAAGLISWRNISKKRHLREALSEQAAGGDLPAASPAAALPPALPAGPIQETPR